ncbi:MAG: c-type cytochrome [Rhodospirillales bacterium]
MNFPKRLPSLVVVGVLVLGAGIFAWRVLSPSTGTQMVSVRIPALSAIAVKGAKAFDANCAQCHGANGAGGDQGPPLVHDIYNPGHHADAAFFFAVKRGVRRHHWAFGDMPPQPQVTEDEVYAIVRYIRELQEGNGIFYKPHRM